MLLLNEVRTKSSQTAGLQDEALLIQPNCQGEKTVSLIDLINCIHAIVLQQYMKKKKNLQRQTVVSS